MIAAAIGQERRPSKRFFRRRQSPLAGGLGLASIIVVMVGLTGCSSSVSMKAMPAEVEAAPRVVREAYAFAAQHPEVMKQLPCYCGCGAIGHKSNYDCYISGVDDDGAITYDLHAVGCSICVDITRDTMRLLEEGHSLAEVRAQIDSTYSAFGPSNMP
jgi:hypothetical protein